MEGELSMMDYSDTMEHRYPGPSVLVLDEFSLSRPMFIRDPGLLAPIKRWSAVVAMIPRALGRELGNIMAREGAGVVECSECGADICTLPKQLGRMCLCCLPAHLTTAGDAGSTELGKVQGR